MAAIGPEYSDHKTDPGSALNAWQLLTLLPWLLMHLIGLTTVWTLTFRMNPPAVAWLVFTLVVISSFTVAGVLDWLRFKPQPQQVVLIGLLVVQLTIGLRCLVYGNEIVPLFQILSNVISTSLVGGKRVMILLATAGIMYAWRKGIRGWQGWIGPLAVGKTLRNGILFFFVLGMYAISLKTRVPILEFLLFLFAGLLAMEAARLSVQAHQRGGRSVPVDKTWVFSLAGAAAMVLIVASGIANSAGLFLAEVLSSILGVAFAGLLRLVARLLEPVVFLLIEAWNHLMTRLWNVSDAWPTLSTDAASQISEQMTRIAGEVQPYAWSEDLKKVLLWVGLFVIIAGLGMVIILTLRRGTGLRKMDALLETDGHSTNALREVLRKLSDYRRFGQRVFQFLNPARRWIAAARIRRIYTQLLHALAKLNRERIPAETPLEYLLRMKADFPEAAVDLEIITVGYLRVRYGEFAEHSEDVAAVERSWAQVRRLFTLKGHPHSYSSVS
jgi:hypothetical protein